MSEMMNNLKSCPVELIEKLILSYRDAIDTLEGISTLEDKRELLESCVLDDQDEERLVNIELIVQGYADFVEQNEASLRKSKEAYTSAKKQHDNEKEDYKLKAQAKITEAVETLNINEKSIARYEQRLDKERAKKLRKNIRHRGLVALAKGAVAATIDGIEKEYSATAQVVMTSAINDTKAVMRTYEESRDVDVDTLESTGAIVEAVSSNASNTSKNTQGGKHLSTINAQVEAARQFLINQLPPVGNNPQEVEEQPEAVPQS